jgi:glycosyltransferase involved in cell wall biosynthesis
MRVLMGMPAPGLPGGPQGHLPLLVDGLRAKGVAVTQERYGSPVVRRTPLGRLAVMLSTAMRLRRLVARSRFDVVHLNTALDLRGFVRDVVTVLLLGGRRGAKLFLKFHGTDASLVRSRSAPLRLLRQVLFERVDGIGVLSEEEAQSFRAAGVPDAKLFVVRNVLTPSLYHADPGYRERHGIPSGAAVLLFAARLIPAKGLLDLLRAAALLRDGGYDFVLVCAGDGPMRREAERAVTTLGLGERTRFLGHVAEEKMREHYANATVLVLPTYHDEGFPMAVFQAVAAGLPVVTTRIRAAADYLRAPDNCLWVGARDPEGTARAVAYLLERPELRARMARNNRALARRFMRGTVAEEFWRIYEELRKTAAHDG